MALKAKSLFLFGFKVTENNRALNFRSVNAGPILTVYLTLGYYNLTQLMSEIKRVMEAADPTRIYAISADRSISGGTQNRVTIATNGAYLDLLFGTGPNALSSIRTLIGFAQIDRTGSLSYQGTLTAGSSLVPDYVGYNFLPPQAYKKVFGSVNVSASGEKESVVFNIQQFVQVEFRHEPEAKVITEWELLWDWLIQQRPFEFTPEVSTHGLFHQVTLESTSADGKGLAYKMTEQLPEFPFRYTSGPMVFRLRNI